MGNTSDIPTSSKDYLPYSDLVAKFRTGQRMLRRCVESVGTEFPNQAGQLPVIRHPSLPTHHTQRGRRSQHPHPLPTAVIGGSARRELDRRSHTARLSAILRSALGPSILFASRFGTNKSKPLRRRVWRYATRWPRPMTSGVFFGGCNTEPE
jgi:hypothetical protein